MARKFITPLFISIITIFWLALVMVDRIALLYISGYSPAHYAILFLGVAMLLVSNIRNMNSLFFTIAYLVVFALFLINPLPKYRILLQIALWTIPACAVIVTFLKKNTSQYVIFIAFTMAFAFLSFYGSYIYLNASKTKNIQCIFVKNDGHFSLLNTKTYALLYQPFLIKARIPTGALIIGSAQQNNDRWYFNTLSQRWIKIGKFSSQLAKETQCVN